MASYSLALQLRSAEQVVKAEIPKRATVTRVLLLCDVASTMLVIQMGLFTTPFLSLIPGFLLSFLSMGRWDWTDAQSECRWFDPRSMVVGLMAPTRYSVFGLTKRQTGAAVITAAMVFVRFACFIVVMQFVSSSALHADCREVASEDIEQEVKRCSEDQPAVLGNRCAAAISLCSALSGSMGLGKLLNLTYSFFPPAAFVLLLLTHVVGIFMQPALMRANEDKELRKKIKRQAKMFERQLDNGSLNESLMPGRRDLAIKIFFFLLDILSDVNCLYSFLRGGHLALAISQSVVFVASACFQMRTVSCRQFLKAILESWEAGVATNVLFKVLLAEKTFEAPLSLFLQYFSAFWVASDTFSFVSLLASMFLSTFGISSGLYASKHLLIEDFELVEDEIEISMVSADLSPQMIGAHPFQPKQDLPFPPPGMDSPGPNAANNVPSFPPPGMDQGKLPSFPPPGLNVEGKGPRRPGQFASATE
eukprot:Skav217298  [mRNA]  locus=scaffold1466:191191:192621:+ [translate_table: standard]